MQTAVIAGICNAKNFIHSSAAAQATARDTPGARWEEEKNVSKEALECVLDRDGYSVRSVDTSGQRCEASMLIERMYSWRGYHTEPAANLPHGPNWITIAASSEDQLFGTLALGLDSEEGLLADALYEQEINVLRGMGRRVCEVSKLAVDPRYGSKEVLASLIYLLYIYAHLVHEATDMIIEVNPRHAGFYKRMLGFRQIGEMRTCTRVNAPAVLLVIELDYMAAQISKHGGSGDTKKQSLYPYFFTRGRQESRAEKPREAVSV